MNSEDKFIPVAEPFLTDKDFEYAIDAIKSTWISSKGKYIEKFEKEFAEFCNVRYASSCNNGTSALHLALMALGIKQGDEVIIPTLTYIATANAVRYVGAKPILVDSKMETWQIDENKIKESITPNTRAIIAVHLYGIPCEMNKILEIAKEHNLYVVEDCAEAAGAEYGSRKVGSIGNVGCFSFFGNKIITTGEGGMCITNSKEIKDKIDLLKNQGMSPTIRYFHPIIGYNYRMTNVQAAIGLAQLEKINEILRIRGLIAQLYNEKLKDVHEIKVYNEERQNCKSVAWMYCLLSDDAKKITASLEENNIEVRPFFIPVHQMPPYDTGRRFPVAEELSKKGINLSCSPNLNRQDIERICGVIEAVLTKKDDNLP